MIDNNKSSVDAIDYKNLKDGVKYNFEMINNSDHLSKSEKDILVLLVVYNLKTIIDALIKKWKIE